jgi:hypothetical protein
VNYTQWYSYFCGDWLELAVSRNQGAQCARQKLVAQRSMPISRNDPLNQRRWIMKLSLALALAAFLGFGAVSASFAQDAMGGITNSNGGYSRTSY